MTSGHQNGVNGSRATQMRRVVTDCIARREGGEPIDDTEVIRRYPELMPELEQELLVLGLLERAVASAGGTTALPPAQGAIPPIRVPSTPARGAVAAITALCDRIDGYEIKREIHRGAQGVVYEGRQAATNARVAIKVRREGFYGDPLVKDRFRREVDILSQLDHPNIVGVIDSGVRRGHFYYVMEYVEGVTLDRYVHSSGLDVDATLRLFEKIAAAVNAAHLSGVIHRDLKPANIIVDAYGEPRLLDFGLARLTRPALEGGSSGSSGLTQTGQFVGSLPWTSPEQAEGKASRIDLRTDIYSLGVILFEMLTGKLPYQVGQEVEDAARTIAEASIPRPSKCRGKVGPDVDTIVGKCLQKEPSVRYQSANELAADVRRYLERKPIVARPTGRWPQVRAFIRRNKLLVGVQILVLLALVGAVVLMALQIADLRGGVGN